MDLSEGRYASARKVLEEISKGLGRPIALDLRVNTWDDCVLLVAAIDPTVAMNTEQPRHLAFAQALRSLLDNVNRLRMEAANDRIRLMAPVLQDHGVDYERGKFQNKLDSGTLTLEKTTVSWFRGMYFTV